jgi:hypothetical protein
VAARIILVSGLCASWGIIRDKKLSDGRLMVRVNNKDGLHSILWLLEHWHHENASIICSKKIAWICNRSENHRVCHLLIAEEKAKLVSIVECAY